MSCLLCENLDTTTFYNFHETITLHTMTPVNQFFKRLIGSSIKLGSCRSDLLCGSCYDKINEVDLMEKKIQKIVNDMRNRLKKRQNIKEQIIISSANHGEIYSVITVGDDQEYFDYNNDTEEHLKLDKSKCGIKKNSIVCPNNCDVKKEISDGNEKIHFSNQHDLKNILNMKIKSEESESWEDDMVEDQNVSVLYDMMDEKSVGIFLEPKNSYSSEKSDLPREPFKCSSCDREFLTKKDLKSHSASHVEDKPYICEVCGKVYRHKSALNIHVGMHNGIYPFKCSHCEKSFTQKGAMIRHNKIHTGEKPYQCEECGKCFTHHTSFTIHKISHSGEKSYKCNVCGLMLMSTSHLKRHMRVHTGEKRYSCSTCGKRFAEKYNLVSHSKLHTKETVSTQKRKFRCEFCSLVFHKRLHLEEHVAKHHLSTDENYANS